MSKLHTEIVNLEAILTNHRSDYAPDELQAMEEDLRQFTYLEDLWDRFSRVPICAGYITEAFRPVAPDGTPSTTERCFPPQTPAREVMAWFEARFAVSVRDDLGYGGPLMPHGPDYESPNDRPEHPQHLNADEIAAVEALSDEQLGYASILFLRKRLISEAKARAETLLAENEDMLDTLHDPDYYAIVNLFVMGYDPYVDDDQRWEEVIWDYAYRKANGG